MLTRRKLWQELRGLLLSLALLVVIGLVIGCWTERERPWSRSKVWGILLNYCGACCVVFVFGMTVYFVVKLIGAWRQTAQTPPTIISDGRTPLERLQEEFDAAYPGRLNKEEPPVPVIPPPRDDNPYSYR